uniref:Uncharacterized protein n=1 Tax=Oryza punctata TaxID=4537 RepID=A0A0E0K2A2_ORYPU
MVSWRYRASERRDRSGIAFPSARAARGEIPGTTSGGAIALAFLLHETAVGIAIRKRETVVSRFARARPVMRHAREREGVGERSGAAVLRFQRATPVAVSLYACAGLKESGTGRGPSSKRDSASEGW